jgi:hypothetical protein
MVANEGKGSQCTEVGDPIEVLVAPGNNKMVLAKRIFNEIRTTAVPFVGGHEFLKDSLSPDLVHHSHQASWLELVLIENGNLTLMK